MAEPLLRRRFGPAHVMMGAALVTVGVLRMPMYWALPVLLAISIALAWWTRP